jgi:hypothetical protein
MNSFYQVLYSSLMTNIFQEVRQLRKEGRVHTALLRRTQILFGIAIVLLLITLFNIFTRSLSLAIVLILLIVGFLLGLFVFSRMTGVEWNEEESMLRTSKMDIVGFASIGLYILFEIALRTFLRDSYPALATVYVLAGVSGTLLGRAIGTLIEMHRVFIAAHSA